MTGGYDSTAKIVVMPNGHVGLEIYLGEMLIAVVTMTPADGMDFGKHIYKVSIEAGLAVNAYKAGRITNIIDHLTKVFEAEVVQNTDAPPDPDKTPEHCVPQDSGPITLPWVCTKCNGNVEDWEKLLERGEVSMCKTCKGTKV